MHSFQSASSMASTGGGALDAGVVHQHVEAVHVVERIVEPGVDLALVADVDLGGGDVRKLVAKSGEGRLVDVADMDLRPFRRKGAGNGLADAVGGGGDHDALCWHYLLPLLSLPRFRGARSYSAFLSFNSRSSTSPRRCRVSGRPSSCRPARRCAWLRSRRRCGRRLRLAAFDEALFELGIPFGELEVGPVELQRGVELLDEVAHAAGPPAR